MAAADPLPQEGRQEGIKESLSKGPLLALRGAVLRALEISHGSCPSGISEVLEAVEEPKGLERLLEGAIRSESIELFAQRLQGIGFKGSTGMLPYAPAMPSCEDFAEGTRWFAEPFPPR